MQSQFNDVGEELYRSWSYEQCHQEIGKLVQGYKNGLPVQILCHLASTIAGSSEKAAEHLSKLLSLKERNSIIKKESGNNKALRALLESTLLPQ